MKYGKQILKYCAGKLGGMESTVPRDIRNQLNIENLEHFIVTKNDKEDQRILLGHLITIQTTFLLLTHELTDKQIKSSKNGLLAKC